MKLSYILTAVVMGSSPAFATDISGIQITGEASFEYNSFSSGTAAMPYVDGATHEAYRFNTAQMIARKETDELSFMGRFVYKPTDYVATPAATSSSKAAFGVLDQIEIYYKLHPQVHFGFGRFLTTMGYESVFKSENAFFNYSIAYQSIMPGYGEGLRLKYIPRENITATVSTYNRFAYNQFGEDAETTKATEASATGTFDGFTVFGGYLFGSDSGGADNSATSIWASYKVLENLLVAITYDAKTMKNTGASTDFAQSTSAMLTYGLGVHNLGLRYENIYGATFLGYGDSKIQSITLTDKIALKQHINFYVEVRNDMADEKIFADKDAVANSEKSAMMLTLGTVAYF